MKVQIKLGPSSDETIHVLYGDTPTYGFPVERGTFKDIFGSAALEGLQRNEMREVEVAMTVTCP